MPPSKAQAQASHEVKSLPVALAWSGGKDSSLTLAALQVDPGIEVVGLVTTITRDYDRVSIHGVRRAVLEAQVEAIDLPLFEASIPAGASNAQYEEAFAAALAELRRTRYDIRHLAFGDLFLTDVRAYRERLLERLGWTPLFPLWGRDTAQLAREFTDGGYRAILTCVDTTQLDAGFAGREFDSVLLDELPRGVDPCGERGEFHTCVYDGPIFRNPLPVVPGERVRRDGRFEYCDVTLTGAGHERGEIRRQLLEMATRDAELRSELAADGSLFRGYHPRMQAMHDQHASRLAIILGDGWPGESQVGRDGAEAAWLIIQHAIAQPELQRRALKLLQEAVARGEAPAVHAAMLEDRIRCFEGRPQLYGTQLDWDANGQLSPLPIDDPETVDARREKIGLKPLVEALRDKRHELAARGEGPPEDWAARQREMELWYRRTGWRS